MISWNLFGDRERGGLLTVPREGRSSCHLEILYNRKMFAVGLSPRMGR